MVVVIVLSLFQSCRDNAAGSERNVLSQTHSCMHGADRREKAEHEAPSNL